MNGKKDNIVASVLINALATFLVSISMGINAVIFPVTMEQNKIETSVIGVLLSLETIAAVLLCFLLSFLLKWVGMRFMVFATTIIRVPALIYLIHDSSLISWAICIFLVGVGNFAFLLLLQIWVNGLKFTKNAGLMMALYSTAISLGLAAGPFVINFLDHYDYSTSVFSGYINYVLQYLSVSSNNSLLAIKFIVSALLSFLAVIPLFFGYFLIPKFQFDGKVRLFSIVLQAKGPMFAVAMAGVSLSGVMAFIAIYGTRNGLTLTDASFLLTSFMLGSLLLETPLTWLSDYFDRRYMIVIAAFLCMLCAVYLPIAIYDSLEAWITLFIWGGFIGSIYSTSLALIGEKFKDQELVVANAGYSLMDAGGGTIGILMIGQFISLIGPDGLPYVIMAASILYFSFALTRYEVT